VLAETLSITAKYNALSLKLLSSEYACDDMCGYMFLSSSQSICHTTDTTGAKLVPRSRERVGKGIFQEVYQKQPRARAYARVEPSTANVPSTLAEWEIEIWTRDLQDLR
jgi:hypothetical protein